MRPCRLVLGVQVPIGVRDGVWTQEGVWIAVRQHCAESGRVNDPVYDGVGDMDALCPHTYQLACLLQADWF